MANNSQGRLLSLDILRGITIAGMLLVNNPGSWSHVCRPLDHAEWIGLTPTDLVFPFFMFVMGVSMYFSLRKFDFKMSGHLFWKILRRSVLLFVVSLLIGWFAHFVNGINNGDSFAVAVNNFANIRILGVLQRLAICYFFCALIVVFCKHKYIPWVIAIILVGYAILLGVGHGYEFSLDNVIARVDHSVFGADHLYSNTVNGVELKFDPEGLISTIPGLAHVLIGFMLGRMIVMHKDNTERMNYLFITGILLTFSGFLLSYGIPLSKKLWTSTFVLVTTGLASSLFGILVWVIDVKGHKKWCQFFHVFGVNPLFLYVLGDIFSILFTGITLGHTAAGDVINVHSILYDGLKAVVVDEYAASCLFAILFVCINWVFGYILFKKKIYIKL